MSDDAVEFDVEEWRVGMFRSLRRLWLFGIIVEVAALAELIHFGAWGSLAPLLIAIVWLCVARWSMSRRGQAIFKMLRGDGDHPA